VEEEHSPPAPDPSSPPAPTLTSPRVSVNSMAELPHADGGCCLPVPAAGPCLALMEAELPHDGGGCLPFPAGGPSLAVMEADLPHLRGDLPVPASSAAPLVSMSIKSACGSMSF
jgi:hypothetical protein